MIPLKTISKVRQEQWNLHDFEINQGSWHNADLHKCASPPTPATLTPGRTFGFGNGLKKSIAYLIFAMYVLSSIFDF